jgi:hypothetical protein
VSCADISEVRLPVTDAAHDSTVPIGDTTQTVAPTPETKLTTPIDTQASSSANKIDKFLVGERDESSQNATCHPIEIFRV